MEQQGFKSWAVVEVMGHQVYCGFATDAQIGGQSFLRVDIPAIDNQPAFTKYLGTGSIFSITPCDEETARAFAQQRKILPFDAYSLNGVARQMAQKMVANGLPSPDRISDHDEDEYENDDDEVPL